MKNLPLILETKIDVKVMSQENVKIRGIDDYHINFFVSDHLQFHNQVIVFVSDIVVVVENLALTELHYIQ